MTLSDLLEKAVTCHRAGNLSQAEQLYREVLALDPDQHDALNLLGVISHQRGNYQEALSLYDEAIAGAPELAISHFNKGNTYQEIGDVESAMACYEIAVEIDPEFNDARLNLAALLQQQERTEEAIKHYKSILELRANESGALYNLGKALSNLGRVRKLSLKEIDYLVSLNALLQSRDPGILSVTDGDVFTGLAGLAVAFGMQDQQDKHIENLRYLTELECTKDAEVWIKSWAYLSLGSPDKAFSSAAEVLNALPYTELSKLAGTSTPTKKPAYIAVFDRSLAILITSSANLRCSHRRLCGKVWPKIYSFGSREVTYLRCAYSCH